MKKSKPFLFISALLVCLSGCSKENDTEPLCIRYQANLKNGDTTIVYDNIRYKDIMGYDTAMYTFLVDSNTIKNFKRIISLPADCHFQ